MRLRAKGRVEAGVKYVKQSFVPLREFRDLSDDNRQLRAGILGEAGQRVHGSTHERPLARLEQTERHLLQRLPDRAPELAVWAKVKAHGNAHVQFEKCQYTVPFRLVRQHLWLKATETTTQILRPRTRRDPPQTAASRPSAYRQRPSAARGAGQCRVGPALVSDPKPAHRRRLSRAHRTALCRSRARQPAGRSRDCQARRALRHRARPGRLPTRPGLQQPALPHCQDHPQPHRKRSRRPSKGSDSYRIWNGPQSSEPPLASDRLPGYIAASTSCSLASANVSLAQYARKSSKV